MRLAPAEIDPRILKERDFKEAPELAVLVAKGELPPVSERLPKNPLVVVPIKEIGTYGGRINRAITTDIIEETAVRKSVSENLMGYERPLPNSIEFNMAESYTFAEDGKSVTFKIREGVKWSDGMPFTVDDIVFWYDDMTFDDNARTVPLFPSIWLVDGKPVKMEKVDDLTLKVVSTKPLGRILHNFCTDHFAYPKHVLAKFHPRYNPEANYEDFRDRTSQAMLVLQPGLPRISAWAPAEWLRGQRVVLKRNPYYWKVDTAGNQLPYADELVFQVIQETKVIALKFFNGEIDLIGRYLIPDLAEMIKAEAKHGKVAIRYSEVTRPMGFFLNWDAPNPQLREAFRDIRVRKALSYALNREEIKEINAKGMMVPCGYSFTPTNPYYSEEAFKKYSQYDPGKAARLLDEAGYLDSDGDGFREFKDGSRFEMTIDVDNFPAFVDYCVLPMEYWNKLGIKTNLNAALSDIIYPRRLNGDFDILFWGVDAAADPLARPNAWAIMTSQTPFWHRNASEEGPAWLREATELIKEAMVTVEPERVRELMERVRDLHTDNIPAIAIGAPIQPWGASTRLGNVPEKNTREDVFRGWSRPLFHEQIFIKNQN